MHIKHVFICLKIFESIDFLEYFYIVGSKEDKDKENDVDDECQEEEEDGQG